MNDDDKWWLDGVSDEQRSAVENPEPLRYGQLAYTRSDVHLPPPTRKFAGWALGLSFIPCALTLITAVAFAIVALVRSRDGRAHGKGMAIAALCIVAAWITAVIVFVAVEVANDADRDESGQIDRSGEVSSLDLREGDCFHVPDADEVRSVTAVPCGETHDAEVYHVFELPSGEFAGEEQTFKQARQGCVAEFREFVGIDYQRSALDAFILSPTKMSWVLDDRGVTCSVYEPISARNPDAKPLAGTLRGAGR